MKAAEIRQIPAGELAQRIADEERKYHQMRLNHSISPLENPSQLKALRRDIARMKTIAREAELNKQ